MKIFDVRILAPGVGSRVENLMKKERRWYPWKNSYGYLENQLPLEFLLAHLLLAYQ